MFLKDNQKYSKTKKRKNKYRNKRIQNTEIEKYPNTFEAMNNLSGGVLLGVLERQSEIKKNEVKKKTKYRNRKVQNTEIPKYN